VLLLQRKDGRAKGREAGRCERVEAVAGRVREQGGSRDDVS